MSCMMILLLFTRWIIIIIIIIIISTIINSNFIILYGTQLYVVYNLCHDKLPIKQPFCMGYIRCILWFCFSTCACQAMSASYVACGVLTILLVILTCRGEKWAVIKTEPGLLHSGGAKTTQWLVWVWDVKTCQLNMPIETNWVVTKTDPGYVCCR